MNIDYNTSLQGHYTLYDESFNVLSESKNLITDWGMRRFVGDISTGSPHPDVTDISQTAFVNNIKFIRLGIDSTSATTTDFQLISAIPETDYVATNEQSTTGTLLSHDAGTGDLIITFTRMTRFTMSSTFDPVLAPSSSYRIKEIGCHWTNIFQANNRYGIFSRATLSPVTVVPDQTVFAKYVLTIRTDANKMLTNMYHLTGTGATSFPNNKTNVRKLPLYTLTTQGEPSQTLNNGQRHNGSSHTSTHEYVQPLFENMNLSNSLYVGSGNGYGNTSVTQDNTLGTGFSQYRGYKIWWLQAYTSGLVGTTDINGGDDPLQRWSTFTSTTSTDLNNSSQITISTPYGSSIYSECVYENMNWSANTGRKLADSVQLTNLDSDTWRRTISFLFTPNELKQATTVLKLYPATLGNWDASGGGNGGYVYFDNNGTHDYGVVTVFESEYNPNPNLFNGYTYSFTFSRT